MNRQTRDLAEFTQVMLAEFADRNPADVANAAAGLFEMARRAARYAELDANYGLTERQQANSDKLDAQAGELAAKIGATLTFNGDPRGYAIFVSMPRTGRSNSWDSERGWGVG